MLFLLGQEHPFSTVVLRFSVNSEVCLRIAWQPLHDLEVNALFSQTMDTASVCMTHQRAVQGQL